MKDTSDRWPSQAQYFPSPQYLGMERGQGHFGAKNKFGGGGSCLDPYITVHIVKWQLLKWCLLFLERGARGSTNLGTIFPQNTSGYVSFSNKKKPRRVWVLINSMQNKYKLMNLWTLMVTGGICKYFHWIGLCVCLFLLALIKLRHCDRPDACSI